MTDRFTAPSTAPVTKPVTNSPTVRVPAPRNRTVANPTVENPTVENVTVESPATRNSDIPAVSVGLSVVVCAYTTDRLPDLRAGIAALRQQTRRPEEIVLVVDHAEDLLDIARREFPDVRVLASTGPRGLSGARNSGVAAASGDVVLFLDDDACPDPDWVEQTAVIMADPDVVGVGGWAEPAWDGGRAPAWFPDAFRWVVGCSYEGLPADGATIRNPIGATMAFRRSAVLQAGGFTEGIGRVGRHPVGCEETELSIRMRRIGIPGRIVLGREAVVRHRVRADRQDLTYFLRRCFWEGFSKAAVAAMTSADDALSSERSYTLRTLPAAVVRGLGRTLRSGDPAGAAQAGAVLLGLASTTTGFGYGRWVGRKGSA